MSKPRDSQSSESAPGPEAARSAGASEPGPHEIYEDLDPATRDELIQGALPEPDAAGPPPEDVAADPIVRLVDVHKSFGPQPVLDGIDLEIRRGEITVILGPSGTGKSVLLKHIVGLLKPDCGEVYFEGHRVDRMGEVDLVSIRKRVGYLFQLGALFDSMTVGENIAFPLVEHIRLTPEQRQACVHRVLDLVGLDGFAQKMPGDLSGGQQRRVALARAIVLQPCLMLYDEPTTGLDPIRADVINELILALARNMGISSIVVTHDMGSANKIADRMILIHEGRIICDGRPEQFRASGNEIVQRFINGEADDADLNAIRQAFEVGEQGGAGSLFHHMESYR